MIEHGRGSMLKSETYFTHIRMLQLVSLQLVSYQYFNSTDKVLKYVAKCLTTGLQIEMHLLSARTIDPHVTQPPVCQSSIKVHFSAAVIAECSTA